MKRLTEPVFSIDGAGHGKVPPTVRRLRLKFRESDYFGSVIGEHGLEPAIAILG